MFFKNKAMGEFITPVMNIFKKLLPNFDNPFIFEENKQKNLNFSEEENDNI